MLITLMVCKKQNACGDGVAAAAVGHATVEDKHVDDSFLNTIMTVVVMSLLKKMGLHGLLTHLSAIDGQSCSQASNQVAGFKGG
jgi:hypothetical protein